MKILNGYAGLGGNRKLWGDSHEITAVELNPEIAKIYSDFFPQDKMIVTDAHEYLLKHFKEYDFIWSSPPCPTHSRINYSNGGRWAVKYPDMRLYQEIILLQNFFEGLYCIENVIGYYEPLIKPREVGRHYFWANFPISNIEYGDQIGRLCGKRQTEHRDKLLRKMIIREAQIPELEKLHNFNLDGIKLTNKRQILRNCVIPELGLHILNAAQGIYQHTKDVNQLSFLK
jgi:DNA (cytosine-5)-methyltransferase 1